MQDLRLLFQHGFENGEHFLRFLFRNIEGISLTAAWKDNLTLIEKELYQGHEHDLGQVLEADNRKGLNRYRELMIGRIRWAVSRRTPAERLAAYDMLKAHVQKFSFLQRNKLNEAWVRSEKGKVLDYGKMHHVPGIFTINWVVLDQLQPSLTLPPTARTWLMRWE